METYRQFLGYCRYFRVRGVKGIFISSAQEGVIEAVSTGLWREHQPAANDNEAKP